VGHDVGEADVEGAEARAGDGHAPQDQRPSRGQRHRQGTQRGQAEGAPDERARRHPRKQAETGGHGDQPAHEVRADAGAGGREVDAEAVGERQQQRTVGRALGAHQEENRGDSNQGGSGKRYAGRADRLSIFR